MNIQPGVRFLKAMHPADAQNKSLISNTAVSLMFWASAFCIRASQSGEALARWAGGSKTLMLSPEIFIGLLLSEVI